MYATPEAFQLDSDCASFKFTDDGPKMVGVLRSAVATTPLNGVAIVFSFLIRQIQESGVPSELDGSPTIAIPPSFAAPMQAAEVESASTGSVRAQ